MTLQVGAQHKHRASSLTPFSFLLGRSPGRAGQPVRAVAAGAAYPWGLGERWLSALLVLSSAIQRGDAGDSPTSLSGESAAGISGSRPASAAVERRMIAGAAPGPGVVDTTFQPAGVLLSRPAIQARQPMWQVRAARVAAGVPTLLYDDVERLQDDRRDVNQSPRDRAEQKLHELSVPERASSTRVGMSPPERVMPLAERKQVENAGHRSAIRLPARHLSLGASLRAAPDQRMRTPVDVDGAAHRSMDTSVHRRNERPTTTPARSSAPVDVTLNVFRTGIAREVANVIRDVDRVVEQRLAQIPQRAAQPVEPGPSPAAPALQDMLYLAQREQQERAFRMGRR